ncbi:MAG: endonuclease [Myxococcales bacterium]
MPAIDLAPRHLAVALLSLLLAACPAPSSPLDAGSGADVPTVVTSDAAHETDSGTAEADATVEPRDAGLVDDAAVTADASGSLDSGVLPDAATPSPDAGASLDASASSPDTGDLPDAGPRFPGWPPAFISAFGLSYDGPVADGEDTWIELTIADPAALSSLGGWSLSAASFGDVTVELSSAEVSYPLAAGDVVRVHGAAWTGTADVQKTDNHPGVWDLASPEPFGPSLKHGLLFLEAANGPVLDAVFYETSRNQGDWLSGPALAAAQKVVTAGEWPGSAASAAVAIADQDREWARLDPGTHEGDAAADWQVVGATLETYYESAMGLTSAALKAALHAIIKDHVVFPYSEVASIFTATDADPAVPGNVLEFYTGVSTASDFNKEHVWAKSHGGFESDAYAGFSDVHALRPTRPDVNSVRWHLDFDEGGTTYSNTQCKVAAGYSFEPRDAVKGDVARALFYMAVRYEGDDPPMPDLELVEAIPSLLDAQGQPNNNQHVSTPRMGRLSTLLRWHQQDPPDDAERARNDLIFREYQRNRNPFVDHPEWVQAIWGP